MSSKYDEDELPIIEEFMDSTMYRKIKELKAFKLRLIEIEIDMEFEFITLVIKRDKTLIEIDIGFGSEEENMFRFLLFTFDDINDIRKVNKEIIEAVLEPLTRWGKKKGER